MDIYNFIKFDPPPLSKKNCNMNQIEQKVFIICTKIKIDLKVPM